MENDLSPALQRETDELAPELGGTRRAHQEGMLFDTSGYQIEGLPKPERRPHLSAQQTQTMRRTIQMAQGYHPFGGRLRETRGETCATCSHCVRNETYNKTFYKCDLTTWTKGPGSDLRKKWPACERWEAK